MVTKHWALLVLGILALVALAPVAALAQAGTLFVEGDNVGIGTATPIAPLHVRESNGAAKVLVEEVAGTVQARELFRLVNNGPPFFIFVDSSLSQSYSFAMFGSDFIISHQQTPGIELRLNPNGNLTISGSLSEGSSREVKNDVVAVDRHEILEKVVDLPISTWRYKADDQSVRHLGPMAEDFRAAFALGGSDQAISTLDTGGVALAAIQGLHDLVREQRDEIRELRARLTELEEPDASADR